MFREPEVLNQLTEKSVAIAKADWRNLYLRKTKQIKRKEVIFELDEWARIEQAAQSLHLTTSEYIRSMTLHGNVVQIDLSQVAPLINGMRTISNNINQIARKAN